MRLPEDRLRSEAGRQLGIDDYDDEEEENASGGASFNFLLLFSVELITNDDCFKAMRLFDLIWNI